MTGCRANSPIETLKIKTNNLPKSLTGCRANSPIETFNGVANPTSVDRLSGKFALVQRIRGLNRLMRGRFPLIGYFFLTQKAQETQRIDKLASFASLASLAFSLNLFNAAQFKATPSLSICPLTNPFIPLIRCTHSF